MANWYVSSVGWTAVTAWAATTLHYIGDYVRQTAPTLNNERVFKATSYLSLVDHTANTTAANNISSTTVSISVTSGSIAVMCCLLRRTNAHGAQSTITSITGGGANLGAWTQRTTKQSHNGTDVYQNMEVWWAAASGTVTAQTITINFTAMTTGDSIDVFYMDIKNPVSTVSPWDANGSLPATNNSSASPTPAVTGVSTTSSNDMLLIFYGANSNTSLTTGPTGSFFAGGAANPGVVGAAIIPEPNTVSSISLSWGQSYAQGVMVVDAIPVTALPNTTGGSEPSWTVSSGSTTTDSKIQWTECTGKESDQAAASWNAPAARLGSLLQRATGSGTNTAVTDTLYVSQDHAETQTTAWGPFNGFATYNMPIICVNRAGGSSLPPVSADLATTATISTTGATAMTLQPLNANVGCRTHFQGITFNVGSGSNNANITGLQSVSGYVSLKNCGIVLTSGSTSRIIPSATNGLRFEKVDWNNVVLTFGNTAQAVLLDGLQLEWSNTTSALAGTVPSNLFIRQSITGSFDGPIILKVAGVDLSALNTTLVFNDADGRHRNDIYEFRNCRLNSSLTPFGGTNSTMIPPGWPGQLSLINCDDSTNSRNYRLATVFGGGTAITDTTVIATAGANDAVTGYSAKITSGSPATLLPMIFPLVSRRWNATSSVSATVYFVVNGAATLTNAQVWIEVEALTNATYPQGTIATSGTADILASGTATTDTTAWNSVATARQNSHAYALGDAISIASAAAGTIWFCTTAGTTAGSEPGGYTSATDGASVNDNTAIFRAGYRQKMTTGSFTPGMKGIVSAVLKATATSATLYVDPKLNIA